MALLTKFHDTLRDRFLAFYTDELRPNQQARVRLGLLKRLDRLDQLRERLTAFTDAGGFAP